MNYMMGNLRWFKDGDDDESQNEDLAVEVTTVLKDGTVELAYDDTNGRAYLRFSLRDLMEQVTAVAGADE